MTIAALVAWLATALGGLYLLGTWIARGGARPDGPSRLPVPVIFGHFLLAAAGLVVWVLHLFTGAAALAWAALVILLPVALLGFVMFARWLTVTRTASVRTASVHTAEDAPGAARSAAPPERAFPVPVVLGHGLLAVATLVLVAISAFQS